MIIKNAELDKKVIDKKWTGSSNDRACCQENILFKDYKFKI
jgi:hypothetical protein